LSVLPSGRDRAQRFGFALKRGIDNFEPTL
jgi:hypothetical protein